MRSPIVLLFAACLALSCNEDELRPTDSETPNEISDTWLQTEYGYSPGSGYFIVPVPPTPPLMLHFGEERRMSTNIPGLTKYKFYRLLMDEVREEHIVAFYEEDPGNGRQDVSALEHSYVIELNGNSLKLHYRWCFEGCHLGFSRRSAKRS